MHRKTPISVLVYTALFPSPVVQMLGLCAAAVGGYAAQPAFWALIPRFLTGAAAAAGIATVNALGNLGGVIFALIFRFQPTPYGKMFWISGVLAIVRVSPACCLVFPVLIPCRRA